MTEANEMGKLPEGWKKVRDKEVQKLDEFLTNPRHYYG
jgi:hypothetical protein